MINNNYRSVRPAVDAAAPHVFIETYGCQMNVNDSEVVLSILQKAGFTLCSQPEEAALVLINTCAIRDNAEQRILGGWSSIAFRKRRIPDCWWACWAAWPRDSKTSCWRTPWSTW